MSRNTKRAKLWAAIQEYKLTVGCQMCGYSRHPRALQFDHLRDKLGNVSDLVRSDYGEKTVWAEIEKCQVLCANCHAEVTASRQDG